MQLTVIAVGNRMPGWVSEGVGVYLQRMPRNLQLIFREIPPAGRGKSLPEARVLQAEGESILALVDRSAFVIALDERGVELSSRELAGQLDGWMGQYSRINLLIGGANGLSEACKQRADMVWSLSRLTLPHALVRVVLAEQVYRAWSLLQGHPYHRD